MFNLLSKLRAAKAEKAGRLARKAAWDAHQVALKRDDDREIGKTRAALVTATLALLRLELGR